MDQFTDQQMNDYFFALPAYIQESIIQSGVNFTNIEELSSCADKYQNKKDKRFE